MERAAMPVWAKLVRDARHDIIAMLPLIDHGLDVAAVLEGLLRTGAWERLLTHSAGRTLTDADIARIAALAALHDIGKANAGFFARIDRHAEKIGHEGQVAALLLDSRLRDTAAGKALHRIIREWGAGPYIAALMAHHGRPRAEFARDSHVTPAWEAHVRHWQPTGGYDPIAAAVQVIDQVRDRYPLAWQAGDTLPQNIRFVALFAGLLVLADWLGSDARRFPVEGPYGARRDPTRSEAAAGAIVARGLAPVATPAGDFTAAFSFEPRSVQQAATATDLGPIALIEAETGSGKTEAALWRWLDLRRRGQVDGLYFALPTRSAAVQLHGRVEVMLRRLWGEDGPRAVLAVPGQWRMGDVEGVPMPGRRVVWDDAGGADAAVDARWAAEHANQFLAARIAVGTIDQALLGALKVRHAPFRAAMLARNLLVVDEVHASDDYMGGLLDQLLANHVAVGGQALLLSATLGAAARSRLLGGRPVPSLAEAVAHPYPALSGSEAPLRGIAAAGTDQKVVAIEIAGLIHDPAAIAGRAVAAARQGASVLVIRNTVGGAVAVAQAVAALAPDLAFRVGGVATVHHGRFAAADRRLIDTVVEATFGKDRTTEGRILVGTQTLEQSLDIDADLLVTDLAPVDVLLQRIGRLHRHAGRARGDFAGARVIVLRPAERDLTPLLAKGYCERHGLGPYGHGGGPYPSLIQLEATLRVLEANPVVAIPADNRRLVEQALHPEVTDAIGREGDAAWRNHANNRAAIRHGDRDTAGRQSLDLLIPFSKLNFPVDATSMTTRLGARDLLIDFDTPLDGPFGTPIDRIRIPSWLAGGVTPADQPTGIARDDDGWRFALGPRRFRYGRWGLASGG